MKYLKTYESMKEDFYKEMESLRKREEELIQSTKEEVDEYMYSLTDDHSDKPSEISVWRSQPDGEVEKKNISFNRFLWDKSLWPDISNWYINKARDSRKRITVESSFAIQYHLKCDYSEDDGYRLYNKKDKLDYFIEELESTIQRVKETTGLEYRLKAKMLISVESEYHNMNYWEWVDMNWVKAELAYRKEVNIYQANKVGKDAPLFKVVSSPPYSKLEIVLEFL